MFGNQIDLLFEGSGSRNQKHLCPVIEDKNFICQSITLNTRNLLPCFLLFLLRNFILSPSLKYFQKTKIRISSITRKINPPRKKNTAEEFDEWELFVISMAGGGGNTANWR